LLGGIRRFFGFESSEEDEAMAVVRPSTPPSVSSTGPGPRLSSTAFRVGEKLAIKGEIVGEGDLELAGKFQGTIHVRGTVVVGERAEVEADITAFTIVVGGRVRGNLTAAGRVEILPQGVLTGNLKTGSFAAADGASVKGEVVVERAKPRAEVSGGS
jgi:cytoskeletal protein CcmA (bactofilin family)